MNFYSRLIVSLALTAGVAAGLLAATYHTTAPIIQQRDAEDKVKALQNVFFLQQSPDGDALTLSGRDLGDGVIALYSPDNDQRPLYYAVTGEAIGYNSSTPISLMVGFTGEGVEAAPLLKGYIPDDRLPEPGARGNYIVGFSVINSEETPGLGEKIKDVRPPYTWLQLLGGNRPPASPDTATDFHIQFRGRLADSLRLKKDGGDLDAITASTITSNGVLAALRQAGDKLEQTISAQ